MVGKRIKHFREAKKFDRHWLGNELGIDATQVNRIENDRCEVTVQKLHRIAKVLNVSIVDLIEEKYLQSGTPENYDKYGPVESSYIRYVIYQNEMLQMKYNDLLSINQSLMDNLNTQREQFRKLLDVFGPPLQLKK